MSILILPCHSSPVDDLLERRSLRGLCLFTLFCGSGMTAGGGGGGTSGFDSWTGGGLSGCTGGAWMFCSGAALSAASGKRAFTLAR